MMTSLTLRRALLTAGLAAIFSSILLSTAVGSDEVTQRFSLENSSLQVTIAFRDGRLVSERIRPQESWQDKYQKSHVDLLSSGGFALDIVWTDWRAPGKANNGDVLHSLTQEDFELVVNSTIRRDDGAEELTLLLQGSENNFQLQVTYQLGPDDFYLRRRLAIRDTLQATHYLDHISPLDARVWASTPMNPFSIPHPPMRVINAGSFGQPAALGWAAGGAFFGLEYPASDNSVTLFGDETAHVTCRQEVGQRITSEWVTSDWTVIGYAPEPRVKHWFMKYADDLRVAPLRPYTLYNSWYDLRSVEYPRVPDSNKMNEENVSRMIALVRENMIEKHDIHLDAFVLDDGWDIYESDWELRSEQFPNGLTPLSEQLKETNTDLGIWFGPTGGYSFRGKRLDWMRANGYEVTGEEVYWHASCLCVGGDKYNKLLRQRTTDFVGNHGVGFFKWDGFQFSCSEPDHGHPIGIYSRPAILRSLFGMCSAVREVNPNTYLNITSGTWLSPWWLPHANQIWMDGGDYGYADVPSLSQRDAAITYRDFVLYDDFHNKGLWFPIANLMTHGIIKGKLQMLGGKAEPIDKFTDNALLYFARGVSMWELYISPDVLTDAEWNAISKSIHWAKDRFDILRNTEMIGGDPTAGEPYGYTHFTGSRGIVAARNPLITDGHITVLLSADHGLDYDADSLVVEKIYPERYVMPDLYSAGDSIELALGGYEMSVYEIYPISEATMPLLSGVSYGDVRMNGNAVEFTCYRPRDRIAVLNPELSNRITANGSEDLDFVFHHHAGDGDRVMDRSVIGSATGHEGQIGITLDVSGGVTAATLAILLRSGDSMSPTDTLNVTFAVDGKPVQPEIHEQKGRWAWYTADVPTGYHTATLSIALAPSVGEWTGSAEVWLVSQASNPGVEVRIETSGRPDARILPPRPYAAAISKCHTLLGTVEELALSR